MYIYGMVGWILFNSKIRSSGATSANPCSVCSKSSRSKRPEYLERGQEIQPASWIFFVSYVLLGPFLVINVLLAIIINSMEEVHEAEQAEGAPAPPGGVASADGTVAELEEIRKLARSLRDPLAEAGVTCPVRRARSSARPRVAGCAPERGAQGCRTRRRLAPGSRPETWLRRSSMSSWTTDSSLGRTLADGDQVHAALERVQPVR